MGGLSLRSGVTHAPGGYVTSLGASSLIMEEVAGRTLDINTDVLVEVINSLVREE